MVIALFGLGKSRSRFGNWIDKEGVSQKELAKVSRLSDDTVSKVCNDKTNKAPTPRTGNLLLLGVKKLTGKSVKHGQFWT